MVRVKIAMALGDFLVGEESALSCVRKGEKAVDLMANG